MLLRSCLGILLVGFLGRHVEADHHDKTLLKRNALGYTKHNREVSYSANFKVGSEVEGSCVNGPPPEPKIAPNVQTTKEDTTCQALGACHIGFTQGGDWVAYDFHFDNEDLDNYKDNHGKLPIEVVIRASANNNKDRKVDMKIYTDYESLVAQKTVVVPGKGFQNFNDVIWKDITLDPKDKRLRLHIFFVQGKANLCSIDIRIKKSGDGGGDDDDIDDDDHHEVTRYVPFAINALEYDDAVELDNKIYGQCITGQPPIDEPDAQTTEDVTCRKLGPCHIGFVEDRESITYTFKTNGSGEEVYADITVRVSSNKPKHFKMEIFHDRNADEVEFFQTKGDGYDNFYDVTWRRVPIDTSHDVHKLLITFTNGNTNMCSVRVEWNDKNPTSPPHPTHHRPPTPVPHPKPTPAPYHHEGPKDITPVTWSAFEYDSAFDTSPESYQGNCHNYDRDDGVDGSYTDDEVCNDRDDSECFIGWTRPDEWLLYNFYAEKDGRHDIRVRVAANTQRKKIKLLLTPDSRGPFGKEIDVPDDGWREFNDVIWKDVYLEKGHYELQVYFVTGYVNLCSTAVYLSGLSPTRYPTKKPTWKPHSNPTRKPTPSPHHDRCYDDEDYRYNGDYWKDCHWVEENNRCDTFENGIFIGEIKCPKSCGYCHDNSPTRHPTRKPTWKPHSNPTPKPTPRPTSHPSRKPTPGPSHHPTNKPTTKPSFKPTPKPTRTDDHPDHDCYDDGHYRYNGDYWKDCSWVAENDLCNKYEYGVHIGQTQCRRSCGYCHHPTKRPSKKPARHPTPEPTRKPTPSPTHYPTKHPSSKPSRKPSPGPSHHPTEKPTDMPSRKPSPGPSHHPTEKPTDRPSMKPSPGPSHHLTNKPTYMPSRKPSPGPSHHPTNKPTDMTSDDECEDDESFRFDGDPEKDCDWVANANVMKRCKRVQPGTDKTIRDFCPSMCRRFCRNQSSDYVSSTGSWTQEPTDISSEFISLFPKESSLEPNEFLPNPSDSPTEPPTTTQ